MMAEVLGDAQGSVVMAALRGRSTLVSRTRRSAQRCDAEPGPITGTNLADAWAPAQQRITEVVLRCVRGHESSVRSPRYISSRPSSNGSSPPARFFLFDRCHTTPGKPFSGTSGSPV